MFLIERRRGGMGWRRVPIPEQGLALSRSEHGIEIRAGHCPDADAHVLPFFENAVQHTALLSPGARDLFIDGRAPLGITVLDERTEIVLGGERVYHSGRQPLQVTRSESDASCRVCSDPTEGAESITCTQCGSVTHEGALADASERRCFSHHGRCPGCQLTLADFAWTPSEDADA